MLNFRALALKSFPVAEMIILIRHSQRGASIWTDFFWYFTVTACLFCIVSENIIRYSSKIVNFVFHLYLTVPDEILPQCFTHEKLAPQSHRTVKGLIICCSATQKAWRRTVSGHVTIWPTRSTSDFRSSCSEIAVSERTHVVTLTTLRRTDCSAKRRRYLTYFTSVPG